MATVLPAESYRLRYKGLANTIAGLILISFLLVAVIPLIITMSRGAIHSQLTLSIEMNSKTSQLFNPLNITLVEASGATKTYIIENTGPRPLRIAYYIVSDGKDTYVVKASTTFNNTYKITPSISIKTIALENAGLADGGIVLNVPFGKVRVVVSNAELLALASTRRTYSLVQALGSSGPANTVAESAKSLKTNYISLVNATDIQDLSSPSSDIIITTSPESTKTNRTIFNRGLIDTICFKGTPGQVENISGGFQPLESLNHTALNAIYIQNIGPWIGSLILGGLGGDYNKSTIKTSLYIPTYMFSAYNESEPGIIMFNYKDNSGNNVTGICIDWIVDSNMGAVFGKCYSPEPSELVEYFNKTHILLSTITSNASRNEEGSLDGSYTYFYSPLLGIVLYNTNHIIYCPSDAIEIQNTGVSGKSVNIVNIAECRAYIRSGGTIVKEANLVSLEETEIILENTTTIHSGEGSAALTGTAEISNLKYNTIREYELDGFTRLVIPDYPVVFKAVNLTVEKELLALYDGYAGVMHRGVDSFGIYYYSGYYGANTTSEQGIYYYIERFYGEHGSISIFYFKPGSSSGLRPYTVVADTDKNGLPELIFTDEWFKPGAVVYASHIPIEIKIPFLLDITLSTIEDPIKLYDLSDVYIPLKVYVDLSSSSDIIKYIIGGSSYNVVLYPLAYHPIYGAYMFNNVRGCLEHVRTKYIYMKFLGRFAVNGASIAQVMVQIRYSFHDNLGGDIDEIDNPHSGVWGFFLADSDGNIVSSSTYIYQQLSSLEDTWPPSNNFVSDTVSLPLPEKNQNYYILFGFADSYKYSYSRVTEKGNAYLNGAIGYTASADWYLDDLEYTVRIEWIGMIYLHR